MTIVGRQVQWYPTLTGPSILFGYTPPFLYVSMDGSANVPNTPQTTQGPLQPGVTFLSHKIDGRTVELNIAVFSDGSWEDQETAIEELTAAMAVVPDGGLGILRLLRDGFPDWEIECVPVDSPRETSVGQPGGCILRTYTLEFFAPMPFWRDTTANEVSFGASGGVGYPLQYPLAYTAISSNQVIDYQGDVPTWPFIEITGEGSNPTIVRTDADGNVAQLALTRNLTLATGEILQIDTQFGQKAFTLIDANGDTSNAFGFLDINISRFWQLEKGVNTIDVQWQARTTGTVSIAWNELKAGI